MGKTLLQPSSLKDSNLKHVKSAEEHTDLDQLTEELQPYMDIASQQLLSPDPKVVKELIRKISG